MPVDRQETEIGLLKISNSEQRGNQGLFINEKGRAISGPAFRLQQDSTVLDFFDRGVFPGEPSHHDTIRDGAAS